MSSSKGCQLISYQQLKQSDDGLALWEKYMDQVTAISLQYPHHFFSSTAKEVIPNDAKLHNFYAYLLDDKVIAAFCVVIISHTHAELLWAASNENFSGHMPELYRHIKSELFSDHSSITMITGKCCTIDTYLEKDGEIVDGSYWNDTHRFHNYMGFRFVYRLNDYWDEGSHASVFVKYKNKQLYGYNKRYIDPLPLPPPLRKEDKHKRVNNFIHEQIRKNLDLFDEAFIAKAMPDWWKKRRKPDKLPGIAGMAFIDGNSEFCTLFAKTSTLPLASEKIEYKFEYDIFSSALTKILTDSSLSTRGVIHYPTILDLNSEIKIGTYFDKFLPKHKKDAGFTIFYNRCIGMSDCMSVLYFVAPEIKNVVRLKGLWDEFADYSFTLIIEIFEYLTSIKTWNQELKDNAYLQTLINCVSMSYSGKNQDFHNNIASLREDIRETINSHFNKVVEAKSQLLEARKLALGHYGHTLKHRIDTLNAFLDEKATPAIKLRTQMLKDLTLILQLNTVDDRDELLSRLPFRKQERFLDLEGQENVSPYLNLVSKLQEWRELFEGKREFRIVNKNQNINADKSCDAELFVKSKVEFARIPFHLTIECEGIKRRARLKEAIYRELFFELLNNVMRHSTYQAIQPDETREYKMAALLQIEKAEILVKDCQVELLVLTNIMQPGKTDTVFVADALKNGTWNRWPESKKYDGPGMSMELLRRLKIGDMYYRIVKQDGLHIFRIGLALEGLNIS